MQDVPQALSRMRIPNLPFETPSAGDPLPEIYFSASFGTKIPQTKQKNTPDLTLPCCNLRHGRESEKFTAFSLAFFPTQMSFKALTSPFSIFFSVFDDTNSINFRQAFNYIRFFFNPGSRAFDTEAVGLS